VNGVELTGIRPVGDGTVEVDCDPLHGYQQTADADESRDEGLSLAGHPTASAPYRQPDSGKDPSDHD